MLTIPAAAALHNFEDPLVITALRRWLKPSVIPPSAEQLAFQERATYLLMRIGKASPGDVTALPIEARIGELVGTLFKRAIATRPKFRESMSPECWHALTQRMGLTVGAVAERAGLPASSKVLGQALMVVHPELAKSQLGSELVRAYATAPTGEWGHESAEPAMALRYIERDGDLFGLQTLGRQIEREVRRHRTALRSLLREQLIQQQRMNEAGTPGR